MRLILRLVLSFIVAAVARYSTSGQTPDTLINADIRICNSFFAHRPALMFVHLDKQIYNPDENISFTAYTLDAMGDSVPTTTLHVAIIDPANGKEVASEQSKMESGFSTGTLPVPDTVANGTYIFIAYSNTMVHQSNLEPFRQTITIRAISRDPFQIVNASVVRKPSKPDSVFWHARIITDSNGLASKGIFEFTIRSGRKVALSGKRMVDAFGEVDLGLPAQDTLLQGMIITATVTRGKKSCKLSKTIDLTPQRINVGYFPEGGKLIHRLASRMVVCFSRNDGSAIHTT